MRAQRASPGQTQGVLPSVARPPAFAAGVRPARVRKQRGVAMCAQALWALDFDGVVCDSVDESSLSAWKACESLWPDFMSKPGVQEDKRDILDLMRVVRPVVETGYENIIQIAALLEGIKTEDILKSWDIILQDCMLEWKLDRSELVQLFGDTRDQWMEEDIDAWLEPNKIYKGVAEPLKAALQSETTEVYIVTTKQERYTKAILDKKAGIDFPMERIYSTTVSGQPKSEVLEMLCERHPDLQCHFVEDKLSTLDKVMQVDTLTPVQLYLVKWGYNTEEEKEIAKESERIELIDTKAFKQLLTHAKSK